MIWYIGHQLKSTCSFVCFRLRNPSFYDYPDTRLPLRQLSTPIRKQLNSAPVRITNTQHSTLIIWFNKQCCVPLKFANCQFMEEVHVLSIMCNVIIIFHLIRCTDIFLFQPPIPPPPPLPPKNNPWVFFSTSATYVLIDPQTKIML